MKLTVLDGVFAVCRLSPDQPVPAWAQGGPFLTITRTAEELSLVCSQQSVPPETPAQSDFRILKAEGPLDFSLVGLLANLTAALAAANVSVFAVSTYDTDYILVRNRDLPSATKALESAGHAVQPSTVNG